MANNPIITASVVDTNPNTIALTRNSAVLIRYHSIAEATMSATATAQGASINLDMYIIRNGNETGYGSTHAFVGVEDNLFTFSAEDSMGNVGMAEVTPHMVAYEKLTCNIGNNRPDGEGNMALSCSGAFYNGCLGIPGEGVNNTLTVRYSYQSSGGITGSGTMSVQTSFNSYVATANLTGLDYQQSYTFTVMASDALNNVTASTAGVRSKPVFHWGESDFQFEVPVSFNDEITVGSTHSIYDHNGILTVQSLATNFNGVVMQYGKSVSFSECGTWYPNLSCAGPYVTASGWYTKTGNVVTVGFFIKQHCDSGYSNYNVTISGLPFTPVCSAAGGGMCSGALVSAGFDFQCFVAETSGNITTRVQACNNTSSANLLTSASGCKYPTGGGELTVSGTITYMTS